MLAIHVAARVIRREHHYDEWRKARRERAAVRSVRPPLPTVSHLEVRLLQDAHQLVGCLAVVGDGAQLLQDVLHQLHVVLAHRLQLGFLKLLVSLVGSVHTEAVALALTALRQVMRGKKTLRVEIENGSTVRG